MTLARPEVHNAFNASVIRELTEAFREVARAPADELRAVVLAGGGPSFSAGADVKWMRASLELDREANEQDAMRLAEMLDADGPASWMNDPSSFPEPSYSPSQLSRGVSPEAHRRHRLPQAGCAHVRNSSEVDRSDAAVRGVTQRTETELKSVVPGFSARRMATPPSGSNEDWMLSATSRPPPMSSITSTRCTCRSLAA